MYKNYNTNQLILPLDLAIKIPENDIAFSVHDLVESIPEEAFASFHQTHGASAYHPRMMVKLILCAYTQSVFSGRKIEALIQDSLRMMWLAQGYTPSYRTINRFRVDPRAQELLRECFIQFRRQLIQDQLITEDAIFIDGTKIEANANKYTFVWRKSIEKHHQKLDKKSLLAYQELVHTEILPAIQQESESHLTKEEIQNITDQLEEKVDQMTQEIEEEPSGSERKKLRSQRKRPKELLRHFQDHLIRTARYEESYQILQERNSYSKTDPDATFMRMKDDHMRNGQLKAGYNLQIATNRQYVLGYDVFPNPTDTRTLLPFLNTLQKEYFELPNYLIADAGYGSEENYETILQDLKCIPLITYGTYEQEQKKRFKKNPYHPANWSYDKQNDRFLCPEQRQLLFTYRSTRKDRYGFIRQFKVYECEDCRNCPARALCTKAQSDRPRVLRKNEKWESYKTKIQKWLSEKDTRKLYQQRKTDVESAFGHLKANLAFTRFSVRGKERVKNEIGFALLAINLRKYTRNKKKKGENPNQNGKNHFRSGFLILLESFCLRPCLN